MSSVYNNGVLRDGAALRQLWGEREGGAAAAVGGDEHSRAHAERLAGMNQRSGLQFGSDVREFDMRSGLAKYGADLSDCEDEVNNAHVLLGANGRYADIKPSSDTVAYDSELDNSDD